MSASHQRDWLRVVAVEVTPNPHARKFVIRGASFDTPRSFVTPADAAADPLASALMAISGVRRVFRVHNFVTIHRDPGLDWPILVRNVRDVIQSTPAG